MVSKEKLQVLEYYNRGLALYHDHQFAEAIHSFEKALEIDPRDAPSKLYIQRCQSLIENPPPKDWDGVFVMTTK